jgi:uncharacterized protein (DUF305 family)
MNFRSKIFAVGLAVMVIASGVGITQVNANSSERAEKIEIEHKSQKPEVKQLDISCIQPAVDKREVAIDTAFDTYYNTMETALAARRTALKSAWAITDSQERATAVRTAWQTFQDSRKAAQKIFRDARTAAWKTYNTDRKTCGLSSSLEERIGRGNDLNI